MHIIIHRHEGSLIQTRPGSSSGVLRAICLRPEMLDRLMADFRSHNVLRQSGKSFCPSPLMTRTTAHHCLSGACNAYCPTAKMMIEMIATIVYVTATWFCQHSYSVPSYSSNIPSHCHPTSPAAKDAPSHSTHAGTYPQSCRWYYPLETSPAFATSLSAGCLAGSCSSHSASCSVGRESWRDRRDARLVDAGAQSGRLRTGC